MEYRTIWKYRKRIYHKHIFQMISQFSRNLTKMQSMKLPFDSLFGFLFTYSHDGICHRQFQWIKNLKNQLQSFNRTLHTLWTEFCLWVSEWSELILCAQKIDARSGTNGAPNHTDYHENTVYSALRCHRRHWCTLLILSMCLCTKSSVRERVDGSTTMCFMWM